MSAFERLLSWTLLILLMFISEINAQTTMFVDPTGIDFDDCGNKSTPCGTIGWASYLSIHHQNYININNIDLFVSGQNTLEITDWIYDNKQQTNSVYLTQFKTDDYYFGKGWTPCTTYVAFNKSISITFDNNTINSMQNWFPEICKQKMRNAYIFYTFWISSSSNKQSITLTNFIFNNFEFAMYGLQGITQLQENWSLHLINCKFENIQRTYWHTDHFHYFITAPYMTIKNTHFKNISLHGNYDMFKTSFIRLKSFAGDGQMLLDIDNCSVVNYENMLGSFIWIDAKNFYSNTRSVNIYNSIFSNIQTSYSLIRSSSYFASWTVIFDIQSCNFLDINHGEIIVTTNEHIVTMNDIFISTSQLLNEDSIESLLLFDNDNKVEINNIELKYKYDVDTNCWQLFADPYGFYTFSEMLCAVPIQFISNHGVVNISNLKVSNSITYDEMRAFRNHFCADDTVLCKFYYDFALNGYSLINNYGKLQLDNFTVCGSGIYPILVRNKGNTHINNVQSNYEEYYNGNECLSSNNFCGFDAEALITGVWFRNDGNDIIDGGGLMEINNAHIYGGFQSIYLNGGYNYISNSKITMVQLAITASPDVTYLHVDNVEFIDVGTFYQSLVSIATSVGYPPPIISSARESIIENCNFSFYDPWGFLFMGPRPWSILFSSSYDLYTDTVNNKFETTLINNTFSFNLNSPVISIDGLVLLKNIFSAEIESYVADLKVLFNLFLQDFDGQGLFYTDGLLFFDKYTQVKLIGNTFAGQSVVTDMPFITINNQDVNCMSHNLIYGFSLHLLAGHMTSCRRDSLIDIINDTDSECWNGGMKNRQDICINDTRDYFIATDDNIQNDIPLILIGSSQSVFASEQITFEFANDVTLDLIHSTYNAITNLGKILMFDVLLDDNMDILYGDYCDLNCYEMMNDTNQISYQNDGKSIKQIHIDCSIFDNSTDSLYSLISDSVYSLSKHWTPMNVHLEVVDNEYYAGGKLYINYFIKDGYGNEINDYDELIHIQLESDELNIQVSIIIDEHGYCEICEQGIYIQTINIDNVGSNYTINTFILNNELNVNNITFAVGECPSGFGKSGTIKQCEMCSNGYFSLFPTIDECIDCNSDNIDTNNAISCNGKNDILINYNYWIGIQIENNNQSIISSSCPPHRCCTNTSGCNYYKDPDTLCANGRDKNSYLCSACINGHTEMIGSTQCGVCERNYYERLLLPLVFAILTSIFILFNASPAATVADKSNKQKKKNKCCFCCCKKRNKNKSVPDRFYRVVKIMIFKPVSYYFQSISMIITHNNGLNISIYLLSFMELFNLSFISSSTNSSSFSGFCLFKNMNAQHKILLSLLISVLSMMCLIIYYLLSLCNVPILFCNKKKRFPNFLKAFMIILLLCMGQILEVIFKILSCRQIDNDINIHFYFASDNCYDISWFAALITLCFIAVIFIIFFLNLFRMDSKKRESADSYLDTLTKSYKSEYWYFEFFILFRRTVIALFSVVSFRNQQYTEFIIILFLIFCLIANERMQPFINYYINLLESICLSLTILVLFIKNHPLSHIITSILILSPILLLFCFIFLFCRYPNKVAKSSKLELINNNSNDKEDHKNESIEITNLTTNEYYQTGHKVVNLEV
eukprot:445763_1